MAKSRPTTSEVNPRKPARGFDDLGQALAEAEARLQAQAVELAKLKEMLSRERERNCRLEQQLAQGEGDPLATEATLAHEIKQPLTAISNYATAAVRMLQRDGMTREEARDIVSKIAELAERGGAIVRKFREFAGAQKPERAVVDVRDAVRSALELLQNELMSTHVQTCLEVPEKLPPIRADRVQIEQVLVNLIRNALEAMADVPMDQRVIRLSVCVMDEGSVEFCISDNGHGLTVDIIKRLFQPFQTTKPDGMGMGLAISRRIVSAHGGWMWAKPNQDRGASFYFALPLG